MSDERYDELDADALAMLDAFAAEERIPPQVHERVWSRVAQDVAHERRAAGWVRRGAVLGVLAAAAVALLWVGVTALPSSVEEPPPTQAGYERAGSPDESGVARDRVPQPSTETPRAHGRSKTSGALAPAPNEPESSEPESSEPESSEPTSEAAPQLDTPTEPARSEPRPRKRPSPAPEPEPPSPGDDLATENRLLGQARRALIDERPTRALARLGEHERRFPQGVLTEERQALRAVALCEAGRGTEGKAAARLFLRAHPHAALAHRVRSACLE